MICPHPCINFNGTWWWAALRSVMNVAQWYFSCDCRVSRVPYGLRGASPCCGGLALWGFSSGRDGAGATADSPEKMSQMDSSKHTWSGHHSEWNQWNAKAVKASKVFLSHTFQLQGHTLQHQSDAIIWWMQAATVCGAFLNNVLSGVSDSIGICTNSSSKTFNFLVALCSTNFPGRIRTPRRQSKLAGAQMYILARSQYTVSVGLAMAISFPSIGTLQIFLRSSWIGGSVLSSSRWVKKAKREMLWSLQDMTKMQFQEACRIV